MTSIDRVSQDYPLVGGLPTTTVTLVIGQTGSTLTTVTATGSMVWTPSIAATTPAGIACSITPVNESGTADRDF